MQSNYDMSIIRDIYPCYTSHIFSFYYKPLTTIINFSKVNLAVAYALDQYKSLELFYSDE